MKKPILTIIGFGRMGKRFSEMFAGEFDVRVCSSRDVRGEIQRAGGRFEDDRKKSISESDYVFLAVPVSGLPELVEELNIHAPQSG